MRLAWLVVIFAASAELAIASNWDAMLAAEDRCIDRPGVCFSTMLWLTDSPWGKE